MNEAKLISSPNFIRDQFILTFILVAALLCRNSFVSSTAAHSDISTHPHPVAPETIASTK